MIKGRKNTCGQGPFGILFRELVGPNHAIECSWNVGTLPRPSHSQPSAAVRDYDALQRQCEGAMNELQSLKRQHDRCEKAMQESEYYRGQHRSALSKLDQATQVRLHEYPYFKCPTTLQEEEPRVHRVNFVGAQ